MKVRSAFLVQLIGSTVPSLMLLLSVPMVRSRLDLDTFAGFTIIVSAIGLLSVLDGGLGRASTYFVSLALAKGKPSRVLGVVHAALLLGGLFSVFLSAATALLLQLPDVGTIALSKNALLDLTFFIPLFVAGSMLRGALEAQQRFVLSSALQVVHGVAIGIAPVVVFSFASDLSLYAWTIGIARVFLVLTLAISAGFATREAWNWRRSTRTHFRRVFDYSKWLFLSNIIGLAIVFADRFVIGAFFDSSIVAAYVLPMELIGRGQILVGALCAAMFPRLVTFANRSSASVAANVVRDLQGFVISATVAAAFATLLVVEELMAWWLGSQLAPTASNVTMTGLVGFVLISSAAVSMLGVNIQGKTRPVAILHTLELPIYLGLLYMAAWCSSLYLLQAIWLARLLVDAVGMNIILGSVGPNQARIDRAARTPWGCGWLALGTLVLLLLLASVSAESQSSVMRLMVAGAGVVWSLMNLRHFAMRLRRSSRIPDVIELIRQ